MIAWLVPCPTHAKTLLEAEQKCGDTCPTLVPSFRKGRGSQGLSLCGHCRGAQACIPPPMRPKGALVSKCLDRTELHRMCYESLGPTSQ